MRRLVRSLLRQLRLIPSRSTRCSTAIFLILCLACVLIVAQTFYQSGSSKADSTSDVSTDVTGDKELMAPAPKEVFFPSRHMEFTQSAEENKTESIIHSDHPWTEYAKLCRAKSTIALKPNPHSNKNFIILNKSLCYGNLYLLVAVFSRAENRQQRDKIRQSWGSVGNVNGYRIQHVFVVAASPDASNQKAVTQESNEFLDILQIPYTYSPKNMTHFHLLTFEFIIHYCRRADFSVIVDDGFMVNTPHLVQLLGTRHPSQLLLCHRIDNGRVVRRRKDPLYVSKTEWPEKKYPPFCSRYHGYILSRDVVAGLLYCSFYHRFFWLDDVFITGVVAGSLGLEVQQFWAGYTFDEMRPHHVFEEAAEYVFLTQGYYMDQKIWFRIFQNALAYHL